MRAPAACLANSCNVSRRDEQLPRVISIHERKIHEGAAIDLARKLSPSETDLFTLKVEVLRHAVRLQRKSALFRPKYPKYIFVIFLASLTGGVSDEKSFIAGRICAS